MKRLALICVVASCTTFESEEIVLDLRVLAMEAEPPEQVVDVDLNNPPDAISLLDQLHDQRVCAHVGDPHDNRRLHYSLTLCVLNNADRCRVRTAPFHVLVEGDLDDPELTVPEPQICATIPPDGNLAGVVLKAFEEDSLGGLGGVYYGVGLRVRAEGDPEDADLFAGKSLRVMPRIPTAYEQNHNPPETPFTAAKDGVDPQPFPMARCAEATDPLVLVPTQRVRLEPVEPDGTREPYVAPTLDGRSEMFTESVTYQWLASAGSFSTGSSGGPRDPATGNPAPLFSDFRAPPAEDLDGPTDINIWVVQRDERLGVHWYETCIRVVP